MLGDLFRRSGWLAFGAACGRLLPLAVLLLASRRLDSAAFASASAGFAWAGVAMALACSGFATVMTQRLGVAADDTQRRAQYARHMRPALLLAAALAGVLIAAGDRLVGVAFGSTVDVRIVTPAALAGALWSFVSLCVAAMNGMHQPRAASILMVTCGLLQGAGMALGLAAGKDAPAMMWGLVAGVTGATAFAAFLTRRAFGGLSPLWTRSTPATGTPGGRWSRSPVLWNTLASASVLPVGFAASALMTRGAPDAPRQLAQYFALEQVHQLLVYAPALVGQALLPILSRNLHGFDAQQRRAVLRRIAHLALAAAAIGSVLALAVCWNPQWFVALLRNPAVGPGDAWPIRLMVMNASLSLTLALLGGALLGSDHIVLASALNILYGCAFIGLAAVLVAHGNTGLQLARWAASLLLTAAAAAGVYRLASRLSPGALPRPQTNA